MPAIDSSTITWADYDDDTQTLTITFKNGGVYEYSHLDTKTYADFLDAPSQGKFFSRYIRDKYPTHKLR